MQELKSLPNRTVEIRIGTSVIKKQYSDLAKECLGGSTTQGINISEMRQRLRILDCVEKANGTIELDPADITLFKKVVLEMQWLIVSNGIVEFVNDVEALK